MTLHRAGLRIQTTKEDGIGCLGLDVGQNGGEVVGFVRGVFTGHDLATGFFYRTGNLVSQTLAVSSTVVDQGYFLGCQILDDELTHSGTLLGVAGHHAEGVVVTLLGVLRRGCHGDLGDARVVVHTRSRNRGARVEVAQYAINTVVHNLLGDLDRCTRVSLVILGHQFKTGGCAINFNFLGIGFFQSQHQAIAHVFTVVCLRAGQGGGKAQLDYLVSGKDGASRQCTKNRGRNQGQFKARDGLHIVLLRFLI